MGLTYMWCGHCKPCLRGDLTYSENFYPLNFGGAREDESTSTFEVAEGDAHLGTRKHEKSAHDHFFGQSTFGTYALAHERNTVKVTKEASLELLGP